MYLHIAVIDDEKAQIQMLSALVTEWAGKNGRKVTVDAFESAESFQFAWCADKSFDILLLDIQMNNMNGFELAKEIRKLSEAVQIVFITGFPDFMAEGYEVSALHYLLKPVSQSKLFEVLDRAYRNLNKNEKFILLNIDGQSMRIPAGDIIYAEAFAHSVVLQTIDGTLEAKLSITEADKMLGDGFIRCHRSYIAGLKYIKRITRTDVIMDDGRAIPLSRRLYGEVNQAFIRYFKGGS